MQGTVYDKEIAVSTPKNRRKPQFERYAERSIRLAGGALLGWVALAAIVLALVLRLLGVIE